MNNKQYLEAYLADEKQKKQAKNKLAGNQLLGLFYMLMGVLTLIFVGFFGTVMIISETMSVLGGWLIPVSVCGLTGIMVSYDILTRKIK